MSHQVAATSISTVKKGVLFEQRSLRLLRLHLSMSLRRVGGKGDGGIDLQGWWWLPSECLPHARVSRLDSSGLPRRRLRIVAQCKAEEQKIGPRFIREFEGTILRHSAYLAPNDRDRAAPRDTHGALAAIFISTSPFTKISLLQAYSSPIPLALLHLPAISSEAPIEPETNTSSDPGVSAAQVDPVLPGTLLFNAALAGPTGLLRGTVEPRWQRSPLTGNGYPGIWCNRTRIHSWTPEDEADSPEAP